MCSCRPTLRLKNSRERLKRGWAPLLGSFRASPPIRSVETITALIKKNSKREPEREEIKRLLEAAKQTSGTPMIVEERDLVREMAAEILHLWDRRRTIEQRIESAAQDEPQVQALRPALGVVTAAVVIAHMGSPTDGVACFPFGREVGCCT